MSSDARARSARAASALLLLAALAVCTPAARTTGPGVVTPRPLTPREAAFVDTLEERTFRWFWDTTNPTNGLTPDRFPRVYFSSVAAVGFALTAYPIGVERGYVTRDAAAQRTLTTLRFLWTAPQGPDATGVAGYHGFYYHFLDMGSGTRFKTVELSTIDTSLLLGGVLFCREYYDHAGDATETEIRALADSIYLRVDWQWARPRAPVVAMGWTPEQGFHQLDWRGYDEAMILYVLALGSPTHPVEPAAWDTWTQTYAWTSYYGEQHVPFPPLFGHQYSHVWVDFRGIRDAYMRAHGIDYFENSRRATLSQRAYAIDNPRRWKGYSADVWGLTASDGPADTAFVVDGVTRQFFSYSARGPATLENTRDDGTLAPTALGGSIPFAPEVTVPALVTIRERYGSAVFNQYGFLDAFNLTWPAAVKPREGSTAANVGWVDTDQLGIDQGPIVAMIENNRSGLVWKYMRRSPYVRRGLERAGFTGGWLVTP